MYRIGHVRAPGPLPVLPEEGAAPNNIYSSTIHLQDAKPRRPKKHRRSITWDPTLDIYDDTFAFKHGSSAPETSQARDNHPRSQRSSFLAQPAQRLSQVQAHAPLPDNAEIKRRRVSSMNGGLLKGPLSPSATVQLQSIPESTSEIKKNPRRRTIYIPADDTTIATIHPGALAEGSHNRPRRPRRSDVFLELATQTIPAVDVGPSEYSTRTVQPQERKRLRQSLSVAPRRVPLQHSLRPLQATAVTHDTPGRGGGKENIPPGHHEQTLDGKKPAFDITLDIGPLKPAQSPLKTDIVGRSPKRRLSFAMGSQHTLEARSPMSSPRAMKRSAHPHQVDTNKQEAVTRELHKCMSLTSGMVSKRLVKEDRHTSALRRTSIFGCQPPTKLSVPLLSQHRISTCERFPVLSEDVSRPELYEEKWLNHQETALRECINALLGQSASSAGVKNESGKSMRRHFLSLYTEPSTSLLHRRLQASLRFGALSIPEDTLKQICRYRDDLQQRQRFMDLWLKTYDLNALKAAAEVVIGRDVGDPSSASASSSTSSPRSPTRRRRLEDFLRAFLVRNEDGQKPRTHGRNSAMASEVEAADDDFGSSAWGWRRTVVRSLMIISVLDRAVKMDHVQGCLFQASSPFKSSSAAIQALGSLLLPSIGNVSRALDHLGYTVSHVQYPLQEFTYRINNLAADLRDGMILTRLVALLLYPPSSLIGDGQTVTVALPSGDMLTSNVRFDQGHDGWVLSQHLKYPCLGRVQKVYNVQIALSTLAGVKDGPALLGDIKPEDVVDGHREKTVGLLWALVSRWGLSSLVDFDLVEREVIRLRKTGSFQDKAEPAEDVSQTETPFLEGLERHTSLLKSWAQQVARKHGVQVSNLSTSFADGKAFQALLDEYTTCITSTATGFEVPSRMFNASHNSSHATSTSSTGASSPSAAGILHQLGCSKAFISLFTSSSTIPTSGTTIPLLAFLASRVLPLARPHFAASSIQRAWRRSQTRLALKHRMRAKVLARECQSVVLAQQRIVDAAVKIQRWWRATEAFWTRTETCPAALRRSL